MRPMSWPAYLLMARIKIAMRESRNRTRPFDQERDA
jgi:hypothetical protein